MMRKSAEPSNKLKNLEQLVVVLVLLYSHGVWLHPNVTEYTLNQVETPFSHLKTPINLGIYLITSFLISRHWKKFLYVVTKDKLLLILLGLALISFFWSASPESTMEAAKGLVRVTLFGAYLATRYTLKEQIKLYAWSFGLSALLSLIICLAIPNQGIQFQDDLFGVGWRGVFYQKTHLGRIMLFSAATFLLCVLSNRKNFWITSILFCLSVCLLLLSNTKNSLISFLVIVGIIPLWLIWQQSYKLRMFLLNMAILVIGGLSVFCVFYVEPLLNSLGKDATLTGRMPLWNTLFAEFAKRPLLGYGYNGFWETKEGLSVHRAFGWAGDSHNGFIEIALYLGIVGLFLLLVNLLINYLRAAAWASSNREIECLFPLLILTSIIFSDLSTSPTLLQPSSVWMIYVAIDLSLAFQHRRTSKLQKVQSIETTRSIKLN